MFPLKDVLCLLAIFIAYGITGHMDDEDAVMLEETQRTLQPSASTDCWPATNSLTGHPATPVRHLGPDSQCDELPDCASGRPPEAIELCPPDID
ncbi:hypothetical protein [Rhodoferax sp.]|uniref:hypothetical protein n=1 Tax=Rhodoferax sp. TaxID=50421 RepID=UPI00283B4575|nr:hypothetical protein [Rhodoferax sp.]MDR3368877.1 hypothetical protein [Rhodoferax sp.]